MDFRESHHVALTRQYEYLARQHGSAFIVHLRDWWRTVMHDPLMKGLIDEAVAEVNEICERFRRHEREMAVELAALKREMVKAHPAMDDSAAPEPDSWQDPAAAMDHRNTLAHFEKVATAAREDGPLRFSITGRGDDSAANELMGILSRKREEAQHFRKKADGSVEHVQENLAPALDDAMLKLGEVRGRHDHFVRTLTLDKMASAGFAAARIDDFVGDLVAKPVALKTRTDVIAHANATMRDMFRGVDDGSASIAELRSALLCEKPGQKEERALERWEAYLRPFVERVYEDLRSRIDSRRSLLGLLRRFKARCEWHDRERLRAVGAAGNEDSLTAELARWLFDQGLSPITKPLVGGLQPDLLEPGALYVEAKQYKAPARSYLKKGMYQLAGTVTTLRGTPHEVHEAFFVVFRQSGPRYAFPERVTVEGMVVFPVLIDIAPTEEAGSRERHQPRAFTEEELGAAYGGNGVEEGDPDE